MVKINYVMYFVKIINGKWNENIRMGDLSNNATGKKKGVPSNQLLISSPPTTKCSTRDQRENFNPLNTNRRPFYLKTQFLPRSKHFSSRLYKPISL
jgi:hypothetical protein